MSSDTVRVVVQGIEGGKTEDVVYELGRGLDLPRSQAKALVKELPAVVAEELPRGEARTIAKKLASAGAEVSLEEPADEPEEGDGEAEELEGEGEYEDEEEELDEDDEDDEDYYDDDDEYEDEDEDYDEYDRAYDRREQARRRRRLPQRRETAPSQKVLMYGGAGALAVVVVAALVMASSGRSCAGCGGGEFRGDGAPEQLAALLPRVATRFARGFDADDQVAHGTLNAGESARLPEEVAGGRCYIWIGLAPDGTDLDLYLREGGSTVSEDQAQDNFPVVQHCVAEDTRLDLEVKMYQGTAQWVVQRYVLQGSEGADQVQLLHELYSKRLVSNAEPLGEHKRYRLGPGAEVIVDLPMDPEWCYVPLGVSPPGTDLDMFLLDPDGRIIEQDQARDNFPALRHCPTEGGNFKVRLLMFGGEGDAVFRVFRGKLEGGASGGRRKLGGGAVPMPATD